MVRRRTQALSGFRRRLLHKCWSQRAKIAQTNHPVGDGPMPLRPLLLAAAAHLTLTACSTPQHISDEYRDIPRTTFAFDNIAYRIFDKPSAGKLVITPSVASAMSDSVIRNVTFGAYGTAAPQSSIEAAVAAYLANNGRRCTTDSATLIRNPQWEFAYTCEIVYTTTD